MVNPLPFPFPLFRSYIGPKNTSITFSEVPNTFEDGNFHFILSFARDYNNRTNAHTNGDFQPHWNQPRLSRKAVNDIKAGRDDVQVVLGIGGGSYGQFPFDIVAGDKGLWVSNAVKSVQKIIDDYGLAGIEVNYDSINVAKDDFAYCVGELIKQLKQVYAAKDQFYVSIAPSANVQAHYQALFERAKDNIDMVDYQMYTHYPQSKREFVLLYERLKKIYKDKYLLVGFSTDVKDYSAQQEAVFKEAVKDLGPPATSDDVLPGIFVYSADDSKKDKFAIEEFSQNALVG